MPKYANDFSQYEVDSPPNDWTAWAEGAMSDIPVGVGGVTGEFYLRLDNVGVMRRFYTWDAIPSTSTDTQVYIECMGVTTNGRDGRVALRLDPSKNTSSEDATAILAGLQPQNDQLLSTEYVDGDPTTADAPFSFESNERYAMLVTLSGDTLTVKAWKKDETEPGSPQLTTTVTGALTDGLTGLGAFQIGGMDYVYFFGVGTEGDSAPRNMDDADETPKISLDQSDIALGDTLTGTTTNFESAPTTVTLSDGVSPDYAPTPTITADGDNWDFSVTVENFAAQAKAAGEGNPIQGLIPGTITVTVE